MSSGGLLRVERQLATRAANARALTTTTAAAAAAAAIHATRRAVAVARLAVVVDLERHVQFAHHSLAHALERARLCFRCC